MIRHFLNRRVNILNNVYISVLLLLYLPAGVAIVDDYSGIDDPAGIPIQMKDLYFLFQILRNQC